MSLRSKILPSPSTASEPKKEKTARATGIGDIIKIETDPLTNLRITPTFHTYHPLLRKFASFIELRHVEDLRTIMFAFTYFSLLLYCWFNFPVNEFFSSFPCNFNCIRFVSQLTNIKSSLFTFGSLSLYLYWYPIFLILCYNSFLGSVSTHNTIHCPMFYNRTNNKIFQIILSLMYGHPVTSYVPGHNLSHHKYTQQRKDVMRTTKVNFRWNLLNGLLFFFRVGLDTVSNDNNYFRMQRALKRPIVKQLDLEKTILYSLAAIFAVWDWKRWLLIMFIPHMFAKYSIITLNLLQHDGCDAESKYNFSRNFTGDLLNYFCMNNGFHTIHHLYPGIHWSMLKEAHFKEIEPNSAPLLNQPSILLYIFRTFIYPAVRIDYLGRPYSPPPYEPDEPWFYEDEETHSTGEEIAH
jgi:fatty acid desaturase